MPLGRRRLIDTGLGGRSTAARAATAAVAEKLELLEDDLHAAAFFLRVFVLPLIEPQASFDEQRPALGDILRDGFALFAPGLDVDVDDLLAALARLHLEL